MRVAQSCPTLCNPIDYTVHGILQARKLEWVAFPFSRGSSNPGIEPKSPTLQADSLTAEPQGKPKNTRVGSLSLPQRIFLTQELNWNLLHSRWMFYQLSYQARASGKAWVNDYEVIYEWPHLWSTHVHDHPRSFLEETAFISCHTSSAHFLQLSPLSLPNSHTLQNNFTE